MEKLSFRPTCARQCDKYSENINCDYNDVHTKTAYCTNGHVFNVKIMSRNRLILILKFLRFSSTKCLVKTRPLTRLVQYFVFDLLWEVCHDSRRFWRNLATNKCLILCKGRLHFRQFIKSRSSGFDFKLF